jgi:anti-sigma B factor antagonist
MIEVTKQEGDIFVLEVKIPEVHTLYVPDLKERIQQVIINNNIKKLVLDLSKVESITSTGIGIFLNVNNNLKSKFRLACASPDVKKVLELTKVNSVIKVFDTVNEAIKSF